MHADAYKKMAELIDTVCPNLDGKLVMDAGSLDVNGTYRPIIEAAGGLYTGVDIQPGKNVDVLLEEPYSYPFGNESFDLIISGSTAEHVVDLAAWFAELGRLLRPGGYLIVITHWQFPEHRYPVDCWRIMPDGMAWLLASMAGLETIDIKIYSATDIYGIGKKD